MKWVGGRNVGRLRAREAVGLHYENPRYLVFFLNQYGANLGEKSKTIQHTT